MLTWNYVTLFLRDFYTKVGNIYYLHVVLVILIIIDPTYQSFIPNLDGGDKASEHIIFGTNIKPKL